MEIIKIVLAQDRAFAIKSSLEVTKHHEGNRGDAWNIVEIIGFNPKGFPGVPIESFSDIQEVYQNLISQILSI